MTKQLLSVDIEKSDGDGIRYSREGDDLNSVLVSDGNVLVLQDAEENVIAFYSPMLWLRVDATYEEVDE